MQTASPAQGAGLYQTLFTTHVQGAWLDRKGCMSNVHEKQAYLQGSHQVSFDASGRSISEDILGVIDIGLRPSRLPNQNRQGVVKLVDMSPSQPYDKACLPSCDTFSLLDRFRIPCQIPQTEDHRSASSNRVTRFLVAPGLQCSAVRDARAASSALHINQQLAND